MNLHSQSDYELVRQYLNGKTECHEVLINKYKNRVFSYIMMVVKDRELAEDIFQDTFIKVIRSLDSDKHLPTVSGDDEEKNIFKTIGIYDDSAEDKCLAKQSHADLKQLIAKLPPEQCAIVKYRYVYDMSFKEIADLTGVSINNLRKMMNVTVVDE